MKKIALKINWEKAKEWFSHAANKTFQETKVVGLRAAEAGRLTTLTAKRYKVQKNIDHLLLELGEKIHNLFKTPNPNIDNDSEIKKLNNNIEQGMRELKQLEKEIKEVKDEYNRRVDNIHRQVA